MQDRPEVMVFFFQVRGSPCPAALKFCALLPARAAAIATIHDR